ncbi:helix-turn-helix domain-containing protein [Ruegeria sp.]|uniref:helix-turn-helix domain-containing protein n=1 Tax=Ruegeria sp. TaxID=1879320 RepID=UPI003C7ED6C3
MAKVFANKATLPAGGGDFSLPSLSVGIFLNDQPGHRLAVGSSRGTHQPLSRNQGWILPAGSNGICEYDDDLEFVMVSLDDRVLGEFGLESGLDFQPIVGDIDPLLLNLSLTASTALGGGTLYRETMQRALAAQIVETVKPTPDWHADIEDARLTRVLDYIHDNIGQDLSLSDMADCAAMSAAHFSKAFKTAVGLSPLQYVIAARLDMASVLLRTSKLSVAEIAWRVGYQDVSRFGQHFRRKFDTTPASFRAE